MIGVRDLEEQSVWAWARWISVGWALGCDAGGGLGRGELRRVVEKAVEDDDQAERNTDIAIGGTGRATGLYIIEDWILGAVQ